MQTLKQKIGKGQFFITSSKPGLEPTNLQTPIDLIYACAQNAQKPKTARQTCQAIQIGQVDGIERNSNRLPHDFLGVNYQ